MSQSQSERIQELCAKIAVEQDRQKFLKLIQELNHVLSAKDLDRPEKARDRNNI